MADIQSVPFVETTPSLTQLPNEVLAQIFKCFNIEVSERQVAQPDGVPTLLSLCLCSKRLRASAELILYSKYYEFDYLQSVKFLRSILTRPDLAQCVKRLHLEIYLKDKDERKWHAEPLQLGFAESSKLLEAIECFPSAYKSELFEDALYGYEDATAAILLTLLPRLQTLSLSITGSSPSRFRIDPGGVKHDVYISEVLRDAITKQGRAHATSSIANLQDLRLEYLFTSFPEYSYQLGQFCGLTSVKKLNLDLHELRMDNMYSSVSNIPHVHLNVDWILCDTLTRLISQFPQLECFTIHSKTLMCDPENVATALAPARTTLVSLSLEVPWGLRLTHPLQGFASFDRLETLDVPGDVVCGIDRTSTENIKASFLALFPPRLRFLTLRRATLDHTIFAFVLLEAKKHRLPRLELLRFVMNEHEFEWASAAWIGKYQYLRRFEIAYDVRVVIENDISGVEYDLATAFGAEGPEEKTCRIRISLVE